MKKSLKKLRSSSAIRKLFATAHRLWYRYQRRPAWVGWGLQGLAVFFLALQMSTWLFPPRIEMHYSQEITAADGTLLHAFLSPDQKWRYHAPLATIPAELRRAFRQKEDRFFYRHPGVNPLAILRAAWNNLGAGRRTSGASTITMQLVRLSHPRKRTYLSKVAEAIEALRLELYYSKDQLFERYLNLVPYGGNVEGVRSAARIYFGRELEALSAAEITLLTIIPNRPTSLRPGPDRTALLQARNQWLRRYTRMGLYSPSTLAAALTEPIVVERFAAPTRAPHLARRLSSSLSDRPSVSTTLQPELQARAEALTADYIRRIRHVGVTNAAVLIVDNRTRAVIAYVGSADFSDARSGGQVDGVRAVRSPGSALKPLLYGLAIEGGLLTPATPLLDVPTQFDGYAPENYDGKFRGAVTAAYALGNSLNVPAVRLLDQLGLKRFTDALVAARFEQVRHDLNKLGLSLALGGCGVRLEELVGLYVAMANNGRWQPLRYTSTDGSSSDSVRLFSPLTAAILTGILSDLTRPDLPNNAANVPDLPKLAWKTGTSYGRRDAWAIGYNEAYTIGVWCGNFTGEGSPVLAGADIATPLLFRIANGMGRQLFRQPVTTALPYVPTRVVCAVSGLPPDTFCTDRISDAYLPAVSPTGTCAHKKWMWLTPDASLAYCSECLPAHTVTHKALVADLPPALLAWYRAENRPSDYPPPHNPACRHAVTDQRLAITSPVAGASYFFEKGTTGKLALQAEAPVDAARLHWFVDQRYLGATPPAQPYFFEPDTGQVSITVTDDRGRRASVTVYIHRY